MEKKLMKNILRAVKHQSYIGERIDQEQQEQIANRVLSDLKTNNYHFDSCSTIILNQHGKKRLVKQYLDQYSTESILCQYIKNLIDKTFRIRYANRNNIIRSLFGILPAIITMSGFSIIKFDFHDYFNSLSSQYIYEKYVKSKIQSRYDLEMIEEYISKTKRPYAGLCTSNALAEVIAREFDNAIQLEFYNQGLIYYNRYVDDCIMIINENTIQSEIHAKLQKCLNTVYHDKSFASSYKCKTRFNPSKTIYITEQSINGSSSFDYLGYSFDLINNQGNNKHIIEIRYGITQEKQVKYKKRVEDFISCYCNPADPDYHNLEVLRHRLLAFTCRTVYQKKFFNSPVWRVRGFISNYGELRYFLYTNKIQNSTKQFLQTMIVDAFVAKGVPEPYFLKAKDKENCGYNLLGNMMKNKTLLLAEHVGYDYASLQKLCSEIGIETKNGDTQISYSEMVRRYLIKVKVGY